MGRSVRLNVRRGAFDRGIAAYFVARTRLISEGYSVELDWYERRASSEIDEAIFLSETAWVILNSGFRESVVRRLFARIAQAFGGFRSVDRIIDDARGMVNSGCKVLAHRPKMNAIVAAAQWWKLTGEEEVTRMRNEGQVDRFMQIPYIGAVTVWHLAKNLGFPVAKPDRHLERIALAVGFDDSQTLCRELGKALGLSPAIVDTVFWRYATIEPCYPSLFGRKNLWRTTRRALSVAVVDVNPALQPVAV